MSDWQYLQPYGLGGGGATSQGGAGGGYRTPPGFRNELDAARSAVGRTPQAEYPDGYLGTIVTRTADSDKLLTAVNRRLTDRSYQRGVHKGEKIDRSDYLWPPWLQPDTGLRLQREGLKFAPTGSVPERLAHMGKTAFTAPEDLAKAAAQYGVDPRLASAEYDPARAQQLARFRPPWQ